MRLGWTIRAVSAGVRVMAAIDALRECDQSRQAVERLAFADIVARVECGELDSVGATVEFDRLLLRVDASPQPTTEGLGERAGLLSDGRSDPLS